MSSSECRPYKLKETITEELKQKVRDNQVSRLFSCFMNDSTEHEAYHAHKYQIDNNCWHFNIF